MANRTPLESAEQAAQLLYARGARRVWAFGSLGEGSVLDTLSDVDLAVEGVPEPIVEQTKAELNRSSPCKVDIVSMEQTDAQLRWFVARGRLIERGDGALANGSRTSLKRSRLDAVVAALRDARARRILDLGCGPAWLAELLATEPGVEAVLGLDKDGRTLRRAQARLAARLTPAELARVTLAEGLFTWRDPRLLGHDAAVAQEVVEHLEPPQLAALTAVLFAYARPETAIVTTPNADYNPWLGLGDGERRHPDHRFEWTRAQFAAWAEEVCGRHGYRVELTAVGSEHPELGPPTQLARFTRVEGADGG